MTTLNASASLLKIEPTVFFTRDASGALRQLAYLHLENRGPAGDFEVALHAAGCDERHALGQIETGLSRCPLYLPDWRQPPGAIALSRPAGSPDCPSD